MLSGSTGELADLNGFPPSWAFPEQTSAARRKGEAWFDQVYRPLVGKIATGALLMTLVMLFALNGPVLLDRFDALLLVSVPLLLGSVIVVRYNPIVTWAIKLSYRKAIRTVIIGSSSHFEIAMATAVAMYGVGSMVVLGTTMGLFREVPIMLGLVYLGKALDTRAGCQALDRRQGTGLPGRRPRRAVSKRAVRADQVSPSVPGLLTRARPNLLPGEPRRTPGRWRTLGRLWGRLAQDGRGDH